MLRASNERCEEVIAESWLAKGKYFCPECQGEVILKTGRIKCAHFAHKRHGTCGFGDGESKEHMAIKRKVYADLISRGWQNVTVEKRIKHHITDIYAKLHGQAYCFEIQCSNISQDDIEDRIRCYDDVGAVTVWILYSKSADSWNDGEEIKIKRWWMMLQAQQFGVNCFVGKSCEVRFLRLSPAYTWVDGNEYGGGYHRSLKQTKTINLPPANIRFEDLKISESKQGYRVWSIPFTWIWWKTKEHQKKCNFDWELYE